MLLSWMPLESLHPLINVKAPVVDAGLPSVLGQITTSVEGHEPFVAGLNSDPELCHWILSNFPVTVRLVRYDGQRGSKQPLIDLLAFTSFLKPSEGGLKCLTSLLGPLNGPQKS